MKPDTVKAKGHTASIIRFDDETVLLPLNADEARRLLGCLTRQIKTLQATGDFPEEHEYQALADNLSSVNWLLS